MFGNRDKERQFTFFHPSINIKKCFFKFYCFFDVALFNMLGMNAIFDLGLKIIPGASFFTLFSSIRYTMNSLVFLISLYHHYESQQLNVNQSAEKALNKADEVITLMEEVIAKDLQLLNEGGYASHANQERVSITLRDHQHSSIPKKDSSLDHYIKPFFNMTTKMAGILTYPYMSYRFLCIPALFTAYFSVQKYHEDLKSERQEHLFKKKLHCVQLKLNELDKQLGTEEELMQLFTYAEHVTNRKIPLYALDSYAEIPCASAFFKFLESKPSRYMASLFHGVATASSVKIFSEFLYPEWVYLQCALTIGALLKVTNDHYQIEDHHLQFLDEISHLAKKILDIQNKKLNLAKAILFCQKEYLEDPVCEEAPIMEYEEDSAVPSGPDHGTMRFFSKSNTEKIDAFHHPACINFC